MKLSALFLSLAILSPAAFADDTCMNDQHLTPGIVDLENGPLSEDEARDLTGTSRPMTIDDRDNNQAAEAYRSIDGTVDAMHIGPRHPWGGRHVVCYASDRFGRIYRAVGRFAPRVQEHAMIKCHRHSHHRCRPAGCRWF